MLSSFSGSRRVKWVFRQDKTCDLHGAEKDSSASHEQCMRPTEENSADPHFQVEQKSIYRILGI